MANAKKCYACGREALQKNELGLNKKLIDPKTKTFYCFDCLAEYLEVDAEFLREKVEEFKAQGCVFLKATGRENDDLRG